MGKQLTRASKPELGFAIKLYWEAVQAHNHNDHDCDPDCDIHGWTPVFDDERSSRDLVWHQNTKRVEVEPSETKTQRARYVARAEEVHRGSGSRQIGSDFNDSGDGAEDQKGHDAKRCKDEGWTSARKSDTTADEETRSNCATQSNHLSMPASISRLLTDVRIQEIG